MSRKATLVVDLGFGDAGKGTTVDYLARQGGVSAVIRFNGGAQARHYVQTPDGRVHGFSQFGAATFVPGVRTHLSRFVLFDPAECMAEVNDLETLEVRTPLERLSVDEDAMVVTPFHVAANRLRERLRDTRAHGTCGLGIGEAMAHSLAHPDEVIRVKDLRDKRTLTRAAARIQERFREEFEPRFTEVGARFVTHQGRILIGRESPGLWAEQMHRFAARLSIRSGDYLRTLAQQGDLIFEGAQGVLLDEWRGFHPHTTWSTTTFDNALALVRDAEFDGQVHKLGVLRALYTRHGPGPFPTHDGDLSRLMLDPNNGSEGWQGEFRVGWFDLVLARYALNVCGGADSLCVTHLDWLSRTASKLCTGYRLPHNGGGVVTELRKNPTLTDLAFQERLTALLKRAVPVYAPAPGAPEEFIETLERALRLPVSLTSFGPSAGDKRVRRIMHTAA